MDKLKKNSSVIESYIQEGLITCNDVRLAEDLLYKAYPDSKRFEDSVKVEMINNFILKDTGKQITVKDLLISKECNAEEALLDLKLTLKIQGFEDYSMYDEESIDE